MKLFDFIKIMKNKLIALVQKGGQDKNHFYII